MLPKIITKTSLHKYFISLHTFTSTYIFTKNSIFASLKSVTLVIHTFNIQYFITGSRILILTMEFFFIYLYFVWLKNLSSHILLFIKIIVKTDLQYAYNNAWYVNSEFGTRSYILIYDMLKLYVFIFIAYMMYVMCHVLFHILAYTLYLRYILYTN